MTEPHYPLREHAADELKAASGRSLAAITPDAIDDMQLDDLQISAATLRAQAEVAHRAGYVQLAANLMRAAELTAVPNDVVLGMYEMLRPGRASTAELIRLAERLEQDYGATHSAALVREAAEAYGRTTNDQRPTTNDQQTNDQRPTEMGRRRTTNDQ